MKKVLAGLIMAGLAANMASADIITSDNFNYTGALTDNGWAAYSGADASITSDGSVASVGSGAEDIRLEFDDQLTGPTFASFMLNVATMPSTGSEYSFGFIDGSTMDSRFGLISENSGEGFGVNIWGTGTTSLDTFSGLALDTDYWVTIYMDGTDVHSLWIDSDGTDFASPDLTTTADADGIDGFFIRQAGALDNGASAWTVGNLVVGTEFADVMIPEPTTMGLLFIGFGAVFFVRKRAKR